MPITSKQFKITEIVRNVIVRFSNQTGKAAITLKKKRMRIR